MDEIKIEVWDATGNKRQLVEVPADAEVNRLIAVLIERMNLPRHSPDGQLMSYKFHHKGSGRQLLDNETLAAAKVVDGDLLRLQPEITAGSTEASALEALKRCPMCGEEILAVARKCRFCGEYLDAGARREFSAAPKGVETMLIPVGRPGSAIASGYLALFGVLPIMGLLFSIPAIICGWLALKQIKRDPSLLGKGRAWFGIVFGGLMTLAWVGFLVAAGIMAAIEESQRH